MLLTLHLHRSNAVSLSKILRRACSKVERWEKELDLVFPGDGGEVYTKGNQLNFQLSSFTDKLTDLFSSRLAESRLSQNPSSATGDAIMLRSLFCDVMGISPLLSGLQGGLHMHLLKDYLCVAQDLRDTGEAGTALLILDRLTEDPWSIFECPEIFARIRAVHEDFAIAAEKINHELDLGLELNLDKPLGLSCFIFDGPHWSRFWNDPEHWEECNLLQSTLVSIQPLSCHGDLLLIM